jgi:hypothetical protein
MKERRKGREGRKKEGTLPDPNGFTGNLQQIFKDENFHL